MNTEMDLLSILLHYLDYVLVVLLAVMSLFFLIVMGFNPKFIHRLLGLCEKHKILKFLGIGMGGLLLALEVSAMKEAVDAQAVAANAQAEAAEAQAGATKELAKANQNAERGQRQERLKTAIEHLGHESDSVRLGGAYELFHLARDVEELRRTVLDVLCAHIRHRTGEEKYRKAYVSRPSEEIQSLLTLLFVREADVFTGYRANLRGSWLRGAALRDARLQGIVLDQAQLQGANLMRAQLQGASLGWAQLQGTDLIAAQLQGAFLMGAQLQGAFLTDAQLQGAILAGVDMRGTDLIRTQLQGAVLHSAHLQGAEMWRAKLQGTLPAGANLQGGAMPTESFMQWPPGKGPTRIEFSKFIRDGIGRESDLSGVTFQGGLEREDLDSVLESFPSGTAGRDRLSERLEPHVGLPASRDLPEDSGAITGAYTEEEAEKWIADYEKAMSENPGEDGESGSESR